MERVEKEKKTMAEKWKWLTKENVLILILGGILLLVIAWPEEKKGMEIKENATQTTEKQKDATAYKEQVEKELSEMLSQMEGAGKVQVMLMLEGGYESVEKGTAGIWENTNGKESLVRNPKITGALVLYDGSAGTKVVLTEAVMKLLGLDANEVEVIKMKKN